MNRTIETILDHRSIRKFTKEPVSNNDLKLIIDAASQASTSSYLLAYSIISVTDRAKKKRLAEISNQPYVADNGHLLLFCADLYRNTIPVKTTTKYQEMLPNLQNTEHLLVATIDAALSAQNAAIAAESLGLGICYIGSIRNKIQEVDELFSLPSHVFPLFGLVIGYPEQKPEKKPRLPKHAFFFENEYPEDSEIAKEINEFDTTINNYYKKRSTNKRSDSWSEQTVKKLTTPTRMDVTPYLHSKEWNKK